MKKFLLLITALMCFTACSSKTGQVQDDKLQVYTSFYCIYDLTQKIAGDKVQVTNLITPGTEPHDWEPTPADMAELEKSDVLLCNGMNMEGWLEDIENSIDVNAVVLSDGISFDMTGDDPHIWLNPLIAKEMAVQICNTLSDLDAENADFYNQNLQAVSQQFDQLDTQFKTTLEPYNGKKIVVSHKAYSYLCSAYNLEQVAIDGLFADSEPSPQQMKEIIDTINNEGITAVFYEELLSKKVAETISQETNAQLLPLNPLEGLTEEQINAGEDYFSIMAKNLESLETALQE